MKLLKYFTLLFLLFLLAFVVFVATQPPTYQITKELVIEMPNNQVYEYVNDFTNWEDWQQFETDEDIKYSYSNHLHGLNSFVKWDDKNTIQTTYSEKDSIVQNFFVNDNKQTLHWKFKAKGKTKTLALVSIKGNLTFKEKIYAVLYGGITSYVGPQLEDGLAKISNYLVNEIGKFDIQVKGLQQFPEINFISQKDSCKTKDFNKHVTQLIITLKNFISKNKIEEIGKPFSITSLKTKDSVFYEVCIPMKDLILTTPESQIQGKSLEKFIYIKSTLTGDYSHLNKALIKGKNYINKNKLIEDSELKPIYIYRKSLPEFKKPSEWKTEILIPILRKKPKPRVVNDSTAIQNQNLNNISEAQKPSN